MQLDRIKDLVRGLVEYFVGSRLDYHALYPCSVVAQSGNTLELLPDDERMRGFGLTAIPLRHGLPGFLVAVPVATRVLLGFDAGDPGRPFAALWEPGAVTSITYDGGTLAVARDTDPIIAGHLIQEPATQQLFFAPVVGGVPTIYSAVVVNPSPVVPPPPGTIGTPLVGSIIAGNPKLLA